jgi:thioredoxin reductase (NADPH)
LQHPVVDLTRCLGCATYVAACPEPGVLELVHGQAMVVNGGVSACEKECPVGAKTVTLGALTERDDVLVLSSEWEAVGMPCLFLAGEVAGYALTKTAVDQGIALGVEVARRIVEKPSRHCRARS